MIFYFKRHFPFTRGIYKIKRSLFYIHTHTLFERIRCYGILKNFEINGEIGTKWHRYSFYPARYILYNVFINDMLIFKTSWDKVFKNEPSNICGKQLPKADHTLSIFSKAVSRKFYLVHSWISRPTCNMCHYADEIFINFKSSRGFEKILWCFRKLILKGPYSAEMWIDNLIYETAFENNKGKITITNINFNNKLVKVSVKMLVENAMHCWGYSFFPVIDNKNKY